MPILTPGSKIGIITTSKAVYQISDHFRSTKAELEKEFDVEFVLGEQFAKPIQGVDPRERVQDINDFIRDPEIDLIMAHSGGHHSNELLPYIDREALRAHPKPFCGYSDNTVWNVAWYTQGGSTSFSGPSISTFRKSSVPFFEMTKEWWEHVFFGDADRVVLEDVTPYFDYTEGAQRQIDDGGIKVVQPGTAQGTVLGGNISTICLLNGTNHTPDRAGKILLIEECMESDELFIRRMLFSLRMQPGMDKLAGVLVGRFNRGCEWGKRLSLDQTLLDVFGDLDIPIVRNFCFGHISPFQTIPIGTEGKVDTEKGEYAVRGIGIGNGGK